MKRSFLLALFALALLMPSCVTKYYLVRHAEKLHNGPDPSLSPAGQARAQTLRDTLANKGIDSIFVTQYVRTQQTAQPTASALGEALQITNASNVSALITDLENIRGKQVLVVGHSNTIPQIVDGLCNQSVVIPEDDFDNLFIVTIRRRLNGSTTRTLISTTYGVPTP